ncbi:MAG TPA: iron ABC transporter permease [Herpetosiphonaceae bacterium]|nr:iron ABC transporter permease [Herpetosiphonaceae bacterium]
MMPPAATPAEAAQATGSVARIGRALGMALLLGVALAGVGMLALMLGVTPIPAGDVWAILLTGEGERVPTLVITTLRLPRFVLGLLAGAALGLVGALLQSALDNPLAEPGLLGVSSGASLVVAVVIVFDLSLPFGVLPALALAGGLAAGLLILFATRLTRDPVRTILIGAAISALLSAMITCVVVLGEPNELQALYSFLVGSLTGRGWDDVRLALPWLAIGIPAALLFARALNLLQLGDELAEGLGLPVFRTRTILLVLSAAMMAAVVSACGPISFIALIAPHMVRRILRTSDARPVLPLSGLLGAFLLTAADLLAREIFRPAELPVGLITVVIGAPLALALLRRTLTARQRSEES